MSKHLVLIFDTLTLSAFHIKWEMNIRKDQATFSSVLLSVVFFRQNIVVFLSLTWLVRRACLDLIFPTDRRLLSLARLLVPGAKHQMPGARCYFLWPRRARYQLSPLAENQLWPNQRQVVLDLSLARVIVLQLSAACASPGFLNCHTLSVFGQHRGISLKITGTGTETATRHFRCLTLAVFFWYSEQLPVLRDQAAMGLCKKKDYVLTTQAMSGVLMREEILRLNNHSPL